jgi:hypothetical protein
VKPLHLDVDRPYRRTESSIETIPGSARPAPRLPDADRRGTRRKLGPPLARSPSFLHERRRSGRCALWQRRRFQEPSYRHRTANSPRQCRAAVARVSSRRVSAGRRPRTGRDTTGTPGARDRRPPHLRGSMPGRECHARADHDPVFHSERIISGDSFAVARRAMARTAYGSHMADAKTPLPRSHDSRFPSKQTLARSCIAST